ncbi:MAG: AmmeMemoRadiSam system protein B [Betaproteobacteria bacterium]|jgi:AmmeMemoRadiSam system protein B|nr:AmmeMemoRadiSam system protein B [Betaproteobacteria bacterium]MDH5342363.1 AmmeMemoRadiSam system protein B [Betaproteobacteria bacterium]
MEHQSPAIRPPAVAGLFYPAAAAELEQTVGALLAAAPAGGAPRAAPKAMIVPHAGYIYSGPTAARAYALLQPLRSRIHRVVLLGPTHRVAVRGLALPDVDSFRTPLGDIPLDRPAMAALRDLPQVVISDAAHAREHSLEVHLPFLQTVLGDFTLIPLAVGDASAAEVAQVLRRLWGGDETLVIISSDLSHFHRYADAQALDRSTAAAILELRTDLDHAQACGATPVCGLTLLARELGLESELIDLCNSGDTCGDKDRVVGYASFAFREPARHEH